jgi:hypothetical protein
MAWVIVGLVMAMIKPIMAIGLTFVVLGPILMTVSVCALLIQ